MWTLRDFDAAQIAVGRCCGFPSNNDRVLSCGYHAVRRRRSARRRGRSGFLIAVRGASWLRRRRDQLDLNVITRGNPKPRPSAQSAAAPRRNGRRDIARKVFFSSRSETAGNAIPSILVEEFDVASKGLGRCGYGLNEKPSPKRHVGPAIFIFLEVP